MRNSCIFRNYQDKDIIDIMEIYNFYILNSMSNFEETPLKYIYFKKFIIEIIKLNLPFIICEFDKKIIGFAYLNKFRDKSGYRFTYENSIYIKENYINKGIGNLLLKKLIIKSKKNNKIKSIIAVIGGEKNEASVNIHKKNGFKLIGTLKKVGYKKNKWLNSILMQKNI